MQRFTLKYIGNVLALGCLLCFLAACSSGGQSPQAQNAATPTMTPTPTPVVPAGTVLFQADWSKGLASWTGSTGWTIVNGAAQSDTNQNDALIIPYMPIDPNYEIDYRFQIVSVPQNGGSFFFKAGPSSTKDGYIAGILDLRAPGGNSEFANPQIQIYIEPMGHMQGQMHPSDYEGGSIWHTYSIQVQGSAATFITDGLRRGSAISSQTNYLSTNPLELLSSGAVVRVSSITITAL